MAKKSMEIKVEVNTKKNMNKMKKDLKRLKRRIKRTAVPEGKKMLKDVNQWIDHTEHELKKFKKENLDGKSECTRRSYE